MVAGLIAVAVPSAGLVLGGGIVAGVLGGGSFGTCVGGTIGVNVPNREPKKFEDAIKRGEILMLVDVPEEHAEEVEELVRSKHLKVEFGGQEPNVPNVSMSFAGVIIAFVGMPSALVTTEMLPR